MSVGIVFLQVFEQLLSVKGCCRVSILRTNISSCVAQGVWVRLASLPKTLELLIGFVREEFPVSMGVSQRTKPTLGSKERKEPSLHSSNNTERCRPEATANSAFTQTCRTQPRTDRRSTVVTSPKNERHL